MFLVPMVWGCSQGLFVSDEWHWNGPWRQIHFLEECIMKVICCVSQWSVGFNTFTFGLCIILLVWVLECVPNVSTDIFNIPYGTKIHLIKSQREHNSSIKHQCNFSLKPHFICDDLCSYNVDHLVQLHTHISEKSHLLRTFLRLRTVQLIFISILHSMNPCRFLCHHSLSRMWDSSL